MMTTDPAFGAAPGPLALVDGATRREPRNV